MLLLAMGGPAAGQADKKKDRKRPASAEKKGKAAALEEQLKELQQKVDESSRAAADAASAMKAVQDLQRQVTELKHENEQQRGVIRGHRETQKKVDEYERRIDRLELDLATTKLALSSRGELAGYDNGFFLQSPNRRFLIRVNALLQAAYLGKIYSESRLYDDGTLGENESTFLLRRALLALGGHIFVRPIAYRVELDFGSVDPGPVLDAYVDLRAHRLLNLRVGRMKIPIGRQFLLSSASQQFVERSGATDAFVPGWDLGAMLHGEVPVLGVLSWQLGLWNGAGSKTAVDDNIDFLYAARVNFEPFGPMIEAEGDAEHSKLKLGVGVSFAYNLARTDIALRKNLTDPAQVAQQQDKDADGKTDNVAIYTIGVELAARWRSLALQGELFYRREDPGLIGSDASLWGSYFGAYGQLSWFPQFPWWFAHQRTFEIAGRFSYWEPNNYGRSRLLLEPTRVHEVGVVVNMLTWKRLVKWQIEYDRQWQRKLQNAAKKQLDAANVNVIQLQVQLAF